MANRTSSRNNYNRSSNRNRRRRRRSRNRRRRMMPVLAGVLFIVLVLAVVMIAGVIRKYSLSDERADQMAYFGLEADDEVAVILQNEQAELHGLLIDGQPYVNFETVQNSLNSRFYWDANENKLLYTLPTDIVTVEIGSKDYSVSKEKDIATFSVIPMESSEANKVSPI